MLNISGGPQCGKGKVCVHPRDLEGVQSRGVWHIQFNWDGQIMLEGKSLGHFTVMPYYEQLKLVTSSKDFPGRQLW